MAEEFVKTLVEEFSKVLSTKTVIGEPIIQEDKVLIPVVKIGVGIGSGSGKGTGKEGEGAGVGGGGGGGIEPVAVIAVFKGVPGPEGVKVLPLKPPSRIAEAIAGAVSACAKAMEKKKVEKGRK